MSNRQKSFAALIFAWLTALALTPLPGQTIEEVCADRDGRTDDAWVRVAWSAVETAYDDVRVTYCVLRGHRAARLAFERNAEIVYFALARLDRRPERLVYTFVVRTSAGRLLRRPYGTCEAVAKGVPVTCRTSVSEWTSRRTREVVTGHMGIQAGS